MVELAGIIILGILAQWFSWKFNIPVILPLISIGFLLGQFLLNLEMLMAQNG